MSLTSLVRPVSIMMSVLMLNHGVITWGDHIEEAYWRMENTEALCRTVWVATQLNNGKMLTMTDGQERDLIEIRKSLGMDDHREHLPIISFVITINSDPVLSATPSKQPTLI